MKTARLIITLDCVRKCYYCCNTPKMLDSATHITDLSILKDFDEVCIIGGEPMLYPEKVINISKQLNDQNRSVKIYLYTTLGKGLFETIIRGVINGVHFTLHENADYEDIAQFYRVQDITKEFPTSISFRLHILPRNKSIIIDPMCWKQVEIKSWVEDCPLPKHETLFILDK